MLHNRKQAALAPTTERKRTRRITMKKILFVPPVLVLTLLLGGCADLFDFNLFQPLEFISLPTQEKLESMDPADALAYLGRELTSPTFIEKMQANPSARAEVEAFLYTKTGLKPVTAKGVDVPALREWLYIAGQWFLNVYGADIMVNNLANLLMSLFDEESLADEEEATQFILDSFAQLVGPYTATGESEEAAKARFRETIEGGVNCWLANKAIIDGYLDGDPDTQNWPDLEPYGLEPFNTGDFLQTTLILWLVNFAATEGAIWEDPYDPIDELWEIVNLRLPDEPNGSGTPEGFEDPFTPDGILGKILGELGLEELFA
jgi:hypothetical protein